MTLPSGELAATIAASPFPPSFDGNPWSYGYALFGLTLVSAASATVLTGYLLEGRERQAIDRRLGNPVVPAITPGWSLGRVLRTVVGCLLTTILMGAFPDVLILLAWGEASDSTMEVLFLIDRLLDGTLMYPALWAIGLIVSAGQAVEHVLSVDPKQATFRVTWSDVRQRLKLVAVVSLIAVGVTVAKWSA